MANTALPAGSPRTRPLSWLGSVLALVLMLLALLVPFPFQGPSYRSAYRYVRWLGGGFGVAGAVTLAELTGWRVPRWLLTAARALLVACAALLTILVAVLPRQVPALLAYGVFTVTLLLGYLFPEREAQLCDALLVALPALRGGALLLRGGWQVLPLALLLAGLIYAGTLLLGRRWPAAPLVGGLLTALIAAWLAVLSWRDGNWSSALLVCCLAAGAFVWSLQRRRAGAAVAATGLRRRVLALLLAVALPPTLAIGAVAAAVDAPSDHAGPIALAALLVTLLVTGGCVLLAGRLTRCLTERLAAVRSVAEAVSAGRYEARVPIPPGTADEEAELWGAVNRLAAAAEALHQQLQAATEALQAQDSRLAAAHAAAAATAERVRRRQVVTDVPLGSLRLEELRAEVLERVRSLLDVDSIALLLRSGEGERLEVWAAVGADAAALAGLHRLIGQGAVGRLADTQWPWLIDDLADLADVPAELRSQVRSLACVPLFVESGLFGVLQVSRRERRPFTHEDAELLQLAADHIALAVERSRLYEAQVQARRELEARTQEVQRLNSELEQRVRERTAELKAAVEELESFSYSVSHDLRAPLRTIDGFSLALLEDYGPRLDADGRDFLRRIRSATQHMGQLIDALLRLSRVTREELVREEVDLSQLVRTIASGLQQANPQRRASFRIEDGIVVKGDPRLLRVALDNLLQNAWKFTALRPVAVIEFRRLEQDGRPVYLVRDNGAGFDMTFADKLFVPFQRLHSQLEFPGFGVGLATVQRIIHRHGGRIWAEAAVDAGATFYFTL